MGARLQNSKYGPSGRAKQATVNAALIVKSLFFPVVPFAV